MSIDYIYDEEIYANLFCIGFENAETDDYYYFEISPRRNDILALTQFCNYLRDTGSRSVGFNNVGFDYPIIHMVLTTDPYSLTLDQIFAKCQEIICSDFNNRFAHTIWERDVIFEQIDLLKINHYDNVNKFTSLKQLEFAMRMDNICDLPFAPGTVLTEPQMTDVAIYMRHDIKATKQFYHENKKAISLREALSKEYGKNMINMSDSKIGSEILINKLNDAGIETHEQVEQWDPETQSMKRRKQPRGTPRPSLNLGDVILPYINFERPEFSAVLDWLRSTTITETKGALSDIPYHAELFKYTNPKGVKIPDLTTEDVQGKFKPVKGRKTRYSKVLESGADLDLSSPLCWDKNITSDNLNVVIDGFQYDFGTGGLHGSVESQVIHSDDEYVIADYDFASWYPHLSFVNGVYPEHLSADFCRIYKGMYDQRKAIPKSDPNNYALKIALNGSYGNSNSRFSPFYDPKFTMTITINGQLILCMLAEQFVKTPRLSVIQVNTDGITVRVPRIYLDHVRSVVAWIEQVSGVAMEEAIYSTMAIRDVNNYISVYDGSGKSKRKGAYQKHCDLGWHQNHSACVVAAAAEAALIRGEDIETFIRNHDNIYDFMIMAKVPKSNRLELGRTQIQGTSRVYVSKTGQQLVKVMPPLPKSPDKERPQNICSGWNMREANDINDASFDDIHYEYYIEQARNLVDPLL